MICRQLHMVVFSVFMVVFRSFFHIYKLCLHDVVKPKNYFLSFSNFNMQMKRTKRISSSRCKKDFVAVGDLSKKTSRCCLQKNTCSSKFSSSRCSCVETHCYTPLFNAPFSQDNFDCLRLIISSPTVKISSI